MLRDKVQAITVVGMYMLWLWLGCQLRKCEQTPTSRCSMCLHLQVYVIVMLLWFMPDLLDIPAAFGAIKWGGQDHTAHADRLHLCQARRKVSSHELGQVYIWSGNLPLLCGHCSVSDSQLACLVLDHHQHTFTMTLM